MQFCISSSVITKDGKFTFVLHQTLGPPGLLEPVTCSRWFDTEEEAKEKGSAALDITLKAIADRTGVRARRATATENEKIAEQFRPYFDEQGNPRTPDDNANKN